MGGLLCAFQRMCFRYPMYDPFSNHLLVYWCVFGVLSLTQMTYVGWV